MTFSNKSPNFDLYWEIITTIGVATIIAKKDVTVAAVKEPTMPANDPVIGFPLDMPLINQYERTPTGKSKLKKIIRISVKLNSSKYRLIINVIVNDVIMR